MKNRIDVLIDKLRRDVKTTDNIPNSQNNINNQTLLVIEEINKILRTCERDLR